MCACVGVCEGTCLWAHGSQSWSNGYFQDAWLVIWGLRSKAGPQDCMSTLNYRTIPPTLKFIFYQLRPSENQAALDSFKWSHQINSTYQNKKEQEPLSKPWQLLTLPLPCLLFSLTACSVWQPAVQSDCLLFFSNCSKAVIQLQRNKNKTKLTTVLILMNCQHVCPSYLYFILSKVLHWAREMAQ